jgi:hypothetical protein
MLCLGPGLPLVLALVLVALGMALSSNPHASTQFRII